MKKVILMTALVFCATMAHAQLSWNVKVGANLSGIENSDANLKLGLKVGGGGEFAFSELFSLRSSLYYTTKGASLDGAKFGVFPDDAIKLNYLQLLPVSPTFRFRVTDAFALAVGAGPYVACRLNRAPEGISGKVKTFDAGVNAGLDFEIRRFVIGIEAEYGLVRLSEKANKFHNINYSLMFGYRFGGR